MRKRTSEPGRRSAASRRFSRNTTRLDDAFLYSRARMEPPVPRPRCGHCGGGPSLDRFDALDAMVRWVEQGVPPESLTTTGAAFPGRSRPLSAYPLHAHYKGQGNPEDSGSFECRP